MEDLIYVTRSSMPPTKKYVRHLYDLWASRHVSNPREKHDELQQTLASELGVAHVVLTANEEFVLKLALKALGCTGEIITTPFTSASTTQAIINSGCTPVFCDIDPTTYTIDVSKIEALITPNTSAILAAHVFGHACDALKIEVIAKKHNLRVIYDGAHAYKVTVNDTPISQFGDCTVFNLQATKLFQVNGWALATNDAALVSQFKALQNIEVVDEETILQGSINSNVSEFHAAMGLCNVDYVDGWIAQRKELYEHYIEQLRGIEGVTIPSSQMHVTSNYSYFPILIDFDRDELIYYLRNNQIVARKYFYALTSSIVSARDVHMNNLLVDKYSTPIASSIVDRVLCLPLTADLTMEQVDTICACIKAYVRMASSLTIGYTPGVVTKGITTG